MNIVRYFKDGRTVKRASRQAGIEVESLLVDAEGKPISHKVSEAIMAELQQEVPDGWMWLYDLGWNNLELVTPPVTIAKMPALLAQTVTQLGRLGEIAAQHGSYVLQTHVDAPQYRELDTLMLPDERDSLWVQLDGRDALIPLGHFASVQFTIDCCSVTEAMEYIAALNALAYQEGWPVKESDDIWSTYIAQSRAGYSSDRYGPAPEAFDEYCARLSSQHVVMNTDKSGALYRPEAGLALAHAEQVNIELFLRSVWWTTRLKLLGGKLVLEIRFLPRKADTEIAKQWEVIRTTLGL
jgi:hypothetical protein